MGRGSSSFLSFFFSSFFVTTILVGTLLSIILLLQTCNGSRLRQRGSNEEGRGGGTVNEAGVFALRDKQEGGRRNRKTTTTTTTTTTTSSINSKRTDTRNSKNSSSRRGIASSTTTTTTSISLASPTLTSSNGDVAQPAALLAPDDLQTWFIASPSEPSDVQFTIRNTSQLPPLEIVVKPQDEVVLPCELGGNYSKILAGQSYRPTAKWLHNNTHVDMITIDTTKEQSGTGHRYIGDSSTRALHIDSARLEDDGIWRCTIKNHHNEILSGRMVKLVILEEPRETYLLIDGRRLDPGNQFVPVKEGTELNLECAAEGGNPPSVLSWGMTLAQTTLESPEQPDNLTVVSSTHGGHSGAHLKVQRGHHNATIICTARHVTLSLPMNASILLDVQYTPSFAITRLPGFGTPIVEGMAVSLKCEVDSNPSSLPVWERDKGLPPVEQTNDGWLNFTKIGLYDSGWYKCSTHHILGVFSSIGYYLFVRENPGSEMEAEALNGEASESRKMEVQIGGAVTLECEGGCWGHGSSMEPAGPGTLTIDQVVYQDAGEYRCVAPDKKLQNTWKAQLPYHIKVTGRPMVNPTTQTLSVREGESLQFSVEFCAEPSYTKLFWLSSKSVYFPGDETRDGVRALPVENGGETCFRTSLHIEPVLWSQHSGEWMLIIRSTTGITDATVLVNVTRAFNLNCGCTFIHSYYLLLFCFIFSILYSPTRQCSSILSIIVL